MKIWDLNSSKPIVLKVSLKFGNIGTTSPDDNFDLISALAFSMTPKCDSVYLACHSVAYCWTVCVKKKKKKKNRTKT